MSIGKKLIQIRQERHYSQKDIAEVLDMSQPNYHKLECDKNEPKLYMIQKLAEFYKIPITDIIDEEKLTCKINQHNHDNEKVITGEKITLNYKDEDIIEQLKETIGLLKKQMSDKDMIVGLQAEKIKMLEQRLA
jgi:transcriptional regulator with XRE-family HTH domain